MLNKLIEVDQIEVVKNGVVQVRVATIISEDGVELSKSYHRHCISPGDDVTDEDERVYNICAVVHTPEVITDYLASLNDNQ